MNKNLFPVTIIIPTRNAATTIVETLKSIYKQTYPISQIIVVDNTSSDKTLTVVEDFSSRNKKIKLKILANKKNIGVGGSYERGIRYANTRYVIFMHSDSYIPSPHELAKLTKPFYVEKGVAATYSSILHPEKIWLKYNFWLKCLLVRGVGKESPGLNGKFDCIDKNAYFSIKGFDDKNYGHHIGIGSDDADFHIRLKKVGKVLFSGAKVVHLHYQGGSYTLHDLIVNRKLLARSYGRLIRLHWRDLGFAALSFAIRPTLVLIALIPVLYPYNIMILFAFAIWYMLKMYTTPQVIKDPRIILLPFITIFLIFYESYWEIESMFIRSK